VGLFWSLVLGGTDHILTGFQEEARHGLCPAAVRSPMLVSGVRPEAVGGTPHLSPRPQLSPFIIAMVDQLCILCFQG
jgi:hypothetical protein